MTTFTLDATVFARLSNAAYKYGSAQFPDFQCVRLEYFEGKFYAIACNRCILAIEYLGDTAEPNVAVNVTNEPALIAWCKGAATLTVECWPGVTAALVQIDGHTYVNPNGPIAVVNNEDRFVNWWKMVPSHSYRVDKGFLFLETELLALLGNASPSGMLCFPEVIDNTKVCVVRDATNPNWIGVFLPNDKHGNAKPATIPGWIPT